MLVMSNKLENTFVASPVGFLIYLSYFATSFKIFLNTDIVFTLGKSNLFQRSRISDRTILHLSAFDLHCFDRYKNLPIMSDSFGSLQRLVKGYFTTANSPRFLVE